MSGEQEYGQPPPADFGDDTEISNDNDPMFVSAIAPGTVDVSLSGGEDDEDTFGAPILAKQETVTQTTYTADSSSNNQSSISQANKELVDDEDDDDPFGDKPPKNNPPTPSASTRTSLPQTPTSKPLDNQLYANVPTLPQSKAPDSQLYANITPTPQPEATDSQTYENIGTAPSPKAPTSDVPSSERASVESKPAAKRVAEGEIEIAVSDPTKVGEGMASYMTYRITTKTTLSIFQNPEVSVNRRFSDFLGLHAKLMHKHLHMGIILPSPPEKDSISMAKVKISKEEAVPSDFIDRRRALLERYLNRLARHGALVEDPDVRDFLEIASELPKSKDTVALSGAGVLRAFTNLSNSVSKLTTKTGEQDQWFEERHTVVIDLQTHLKHVYNQFFGLLGQRKEAAHLLKQFSVYLNHLATVEEHPSLSSALTELANLQEKLDQINNEHAYKEYSLLTELFKEYVSLFDMILLAFTERIKAHQQWLHAEDTLAKAREKKTKLEQNPKGLDKIPQAEKDIVDWEEKVTKSKETFEQISVTIKGEMEGFEETRIDDFKKAINNYLKNLIEQQEKILQLWEGYLPEANKITA